MSAAAPDVLVVGAGVVGCAVAYHAAGQGFKVTVVDQGSIGAQASRVAAGMLAAQVECEHPGPLFELCLAGRAAYPPLAEALKDETGIDLELGPTGILRTASTAQERETLLARAHWQAGLGLPVEWVEGEELRRLEPALGPVLGGLYVPQDSQVRSDRVVQALAAGALRRGVEFRQGCPVLGLQRQGQRVTGVVTPQGPLAAGAVVLAAGAWSGLVARSIGLQVPVWPVKGQIVPVRPLQPLRLTVFGSGCYLVPKRDGQVLVGATMEEAGFHQEPTLAALARLGAAAASLVPSLAAAAPLPAQVGLRPGSPDHLPLLGPVPGWEGLYLATGHFRNGILLGPLTGALLADVLAGRTPGLDLAPFSPGRFPQLAGLSA